jgi:type II secretory pathway pseudopilin PulG
MKNRQTGFSLVELGVAVTIIALLLAGALVPLSVQVDVRNVTDTQRSMELAREAILGFAQANGRLPCPADGLAGAGTEQVTGATCNVFFGVVPWSTLGVPETDGWGRRFSYWVSPNFGGAGGAFFGCAAAPVPQPSPPTSFALCTPGTLTVNTRDRNHTINPVGRFLPAVIVSHGKNGVGAYRPGVVTPPLTPAGADEAANAFHNAAASTFWSRTPTPSAAVCSDAGPGAFCEFDDIVVMVSSSVLTARMVAAGRLP